MTKKTLALGLSIVFLIIATVRIANAAPEFKSGIKLFGTSTIDFLANSGQLSELSYSGNAATSDFAVEASLAYYAGSADSVPWTGVTGRPLLNQDLSSTSSPTFTSLTLTGSLNLPNTTHANQQGIIYKDGSLFAHDFNYGNNGTVTTYGENTFYGISSGNLTMGSTATELYHSSTNAAFGFSSLHSNTLGYSNTAVGYASLADNTTGSYNTAVGYGAAAANTTGGDNVAIGESSFMYNTNGIRNTVVGTDALFYNDGGEGNIALGFGAGTYLTDAVTPLYNSDFSIYIGYRSRALVNSSTNEIVIGSLAEGLGSNSVVLGNSNVMKTLIRGNVGIDTDSPTQVLDVNGKIAARGQKAIDFPVGFQGTVYLGSQGGDYLSAGTGGGGEWNTYVGIDTGVANSTGYWNTAIGGSPLYANTTGSKNTAIGDDVLFSNTSGSENTALGQGALYSISTESSNVAIGYNAGRLLTGDNQFVVDNNARSNSTKAKTDALIYGVFSSSTPTNQIVALGGGGKVGIGTIAPSYMLDVQGGYINSSDGLCIAGVCQTSWSALGGGGASVWATSSTHIYNSNAGNVGIGTSSPVQKLDVYGNINLSGLIYKDNNSENSFDTLNWYSSNAAKIITNHGTGIQLNADTANSGAGIDIGGTSVGIGNALADTIVFTTNNTARMGLNSKGQVAIGTSGFHGTLSVGFPESTASSSLWLQSRTVGQSAPFISMVDSSGTSYLDINSNCQAENFIGVGAGASVNTGICSAALFIGVNAGNRSTSGMNVALGPNALMNNTTGVSNTTVGTASMYSSTGDYNSVLGKDAYYNNAGSNNIAIGFSALKGINGSPNSSDDVAIGVSALALYGGGGTSVAVGNRAGYSSGGGYNTLMGHEAGYANITGINNVMFGYRAGYSSSGQGNIFIGYQAGYNNALKDLDNQLVIDNSNTAEPLIYGDFTGNRVGINTATLSTSTLTVNGSIQAGSFWYESDRNLKKNIKTLDNSLEKIKQLRGVSFTWKKDNVSSIGLVAQEVEKVFPELVSGGDTKAVQYSNLVAPLIEAVKEQQAQIEDLQARLKKLEAKK